MYFIVNPAAANGRGARSWKEYRKRLLLAFPGMGECITEHPGHASQLARELVEEGVRRIIAVGGDGTHQEVVNGLYEALGAARLHEVLYALLPLGSGNDWIRTYGIPRKLEAWIDYYKSGSPQRQNLGLIHYQNSAGHAKQRIFTNVAGMAYDAYVVERSANSKLKNRWLYPLLTMAYLWEYQPPELELRFEDSAPVKSRFHTINVGICRYNGGGMRLVPQADPQGKTFALTYAPALTIPTILANGWRFYTDTIGRVPGVVCTSAKSIEVTAVGAKTDLVVEADGEWLGYGPLRFELLEGVLRFLGV